VPPGAALEIELTLLGWKKVEKVTGGVAMYCCTCTATCVLL
jgi:hypothetical protein